MDKQKLMQALGLGMKSQNLVWGTKLFDQIKTQKVFGVIVTSDMGASQKKKLINQCQYYQIPFFPSLLTQQELSQACGKSKIVAVGIKDGNLFQLIKSIIN